MLRLVMFEVLYSKSSSNYDFYKRSELTSDNASTVTNLPIVVLTSIFNNYLHSLILEATHCT